MELHTAVLYAVLLWNCCTILNALFTVQARKSHYTVEYGGEVTMECNFPVKSKSDVGNMNVLWKHITDKEESVEVVKYINGKDVQVLQDKDYRGRVKLLSHELYKGRAILQISNVKITDAGQYFCIISSQGSDYKTINLEVQAPYKEIKTGVTDVVTLSGQTMKEISCQSYGYPEADVTWLSDRGNISVVHNTSYTLTADRLFNVTSVIRMFDAANMTLTCRFWNKAVQNSTSLTFTFPVSETTSNENSGEWILPAVIVTILIVLTVIAIKMHDRCTRFSAKAKNIYSNIPTNATLNNDTSVPSTGTCSGYISEHTALDVENT
ncbi:programmed cell death 1 ligand 1-like [Mixophyes fleayi]|uniref:programmed cell death 1 ligand 1-like n=1 Tax=Mixophyes fleayi TaxID=3061075 RepID=UPI003F4E0933